MTTFNTADLIVLSIVAIVLFLFRQLDKNNRSLEKVRKYADKVRAELDKLTKEKKTEIHDLNIDIELQEKTNREILKRIQTANNEALQRSEELDTIRTQLDTTTNRLSDLDELTRNVDENLQRIRKESEYVDSVGIRLNDLIKRSEELRVGMEELVGNFKDENTVSMNELKDVFSGEMTREYRHFQEEFQTLQGQLDSFQNSVSDLVEQRDRVASEKMQDFTRQMALVENDYNLRIEKVSQEAVAIESEVFNELKEKLSSHRDDLQNKWTDSSDNLSRKIDETSNYLEDHMTSLREEMDKTSAHLSQTTGEQDHVLSSMKEELEIMLQAFTASRTNMTRVKEEVDQDLDKMESRLEAHRSDVETRLTDFSTSFTGRIEDTAETLQLESLKAIEMKLKEYESGFFPRFTRLEQFMEDMDTLEESLRETMTDVQTSVIEDFSHFDLKMQGLRSDEEKETEARAEKLHQAMKELEQGLDELKSRAYDNVSEQLQVFEDDFFADLKKRDNTLQTSLKEWQNTLNLQISEIADQQTRDRDEIERSYSAEMNKRLSEVQTRVYQQMEKFQTQVDSFRNTIEAGLTEGSGMVASYQDNLSGEIVTLKQDSIDYMTGILEKMKTDLQDRLDESSKKLTQNMDSLYVELDQNKKDFHSQSESIQSDVSAWQSRVLQQIKDQESTINDRYSDFKDVVTGEIQEIQDDFKYQKEELILSTTEERTDLKQDLASISEKVYQLQNELKDKTSQTLDKFNSDYNLFILEFQKKMRDSQNDAELKIREMKQGASDAREKMDTFQKKIFTRIEDDSRHLSDNLDEINRKQKEFISQTHVFDKADQLKESLNRDLIDLKKEIQKVEGNMDRLQEYQGGFEQVQDQYREVLNQINRFMDEKQKVDELEDKISRMVGLSKSVDLKLDQISSLHEMLQQYQVRVKELEDQHHAIDSRFARIESKAKIVDQTVDSVDRYTAILADIEHNLTSVKNEVDPLNARMKEVESRDQIIMANRDLTEEIYDKISSLSQILDDLDRRTEKIDKAREWIARTETRMDGVAKQAQDQVKLIGRLAERDGRPESTRAGGSPDMDTRETVLRLARLGWKTEDVARTLKLSRGEVELILEITPKG
ncbi:MAG: hypothetical protein B6241_01320 [Spirochaetaceae bacterium 4572_59]|nr:MAG: hypothetical protein B6241_01320 [Spirochaetaceae bacterium 4572_59]